MLSFTATDMSDIEREAAKAPVLLTSDNRPRFVVMSIEDFVRTNRGRVLAGPESFPDTVMARIRELEHAYPDVAPQVAGGLASLVDEEGEELVVGPHP